MGVVYDAQFYEGQADGSLRSAMVIAPLIVELLHPASVVDVGCGVGTWLSAFRMAGIHDLTGLDGDYVDRARLQIPAESFIPSDLSNPPSLGRRFDLAVSMEVAEHLPERQADAFVQYLTDLAPTVLFSAAIPAQGGLAHVNEQWPSYWAAKFERHGYSVHDVVRPAVWDRPEVEWFYAQNVLLYTHPDAPQLAETADRPIDVVHPRAWDHSHRPLTVGRIARETPGAIRRAVLHRIGPTISRPPRSSRAPSPDREPVGPRGSHVRQ